MIWKVGLLVTALAAATVSAINVTVSAINKTDPFGGLDADGVIINKTELLRISDEDMDFYIENSIEERKVCAPTTSCTRAGGKCIKGGAKCDGTVDKKGCKGGKTCKCCKPVISSAITTTTAAAATTTDAATTTTAAATEMPECSDVHGFLPLPGTSKCVGIVNKDKDVNWYQAKTSCRVEGRKRNITMTMAKTSNKNAVQIRDALVKQNGDVGAHGWLDARYTGLQYAWSDGELISNHNMLWLSGKGQPILTPDYCLIILNSEGWLKESPSTAYYSTPCKEITYPRRAFCEFDLLKENYRP